MSGYQIDRSRWAKLSILEQMGNIYIEIGRTLAAAKSGNQPALSAAVARALDLFNATVLSLVDQKSPRVKEVLRARDQYLQVFYGDDGLVNAPALEQYFYQFALAARRNK